MRKHYLLLFLAALLLPLGAKAQETLTVADSTATSGTIPVWGLWLDENTHTQTVYPAEMLDELAGNDIVSLKWYLSSAPGSAWGSVFTIRLMTVDGATPASAFIDVSSATQVYQGTLTVAGNEIEIELDEAFTYEGGGLLVDFQSVASNYSSCNFFGATASTYVSRYVHGSDSGYESTFMPKLTVGYELGNPDACRRVKGLTVTEIDSATATITWIDTANLAASYDIEVISGTDTQVVATAISGTSYTFTGLNANTPYTFGVRAVCAADNAASWATVKARTACAADMALPYTTGFEGDYDDDYHPLCWTVLRPALYMSGSDTLYAPLVWADYGVGESDALGFIQNAADTAWIITNRVPSGSVAKLWMRSVVGTVHVGFLTDTADLSTFVEAYAVSPSIAFDYTEYDIYTDEFTSGAGGWLAFYAEGQTRAFVDDMRVEAASGCRRPATARVVPGSVTYNSASVEWTDADGEAWQVLCSTMPFDTAESSSTAVVTAAAEPTATLTGLTAATPYYVLVRTVCEGGAVSPWRSAGSFTTALACAAVENLTVGSTSATSAFVSWQYAGEGLTLPESGVNLRLYQDDSLVRSWSITADQGTSTFLTGLTTGADYTLYVTTICEPDSADASMVQFSPAGCGSTPTGNSTTTYYPYYSLYNYSISQTIVSQMTVAGMDTIYGIALHVAEGSVTRTLDVYIGQTQQSILGGYVPVDATMIKVVDAQSHTNASAGWDTILFDTPYVNTHAGNLIITFDDNTGSWLSGPSFYSHDSGRTYFSYGDYTDYDPASSGSYYYDDAQADMTFVGNCEETCPAPNLGVAATDGASATLQWVRGADESSWVVQYRAAAAAAWTTEPPAADTTAVVADLEPHTCYLFRVGVVCDGDTSWSNIATAYTACAELDELPLIEGFENTPADIDPYCWTVLEPATDGYSYHYVTNMYHGGAQSMMLSPSGVQYLVSPRLPAGTDPTTLEVDFWANISNGCQNFEVGFMTDPADPATFEPLYARGGNEGTWAEYTIYTTATELTADDNIYVAWRYTSIDGYSASYIDDIQISISGCNRPVDLHLAGLSDASLGAAWTGNDDATAFEYCVTTSSTAPADSVELLTTSETSFTIDSLQPNTDYWVWVRTVCGEETTQWAFPLSVRTLCAPESAPYVEDFDSWTDISPCWATYTGAWDTVPTLASGYSFSVSQGNFGSYIQLQGSALGFNLWSNYKVWAISPQVVISADAALGFDIVVSGYSGVTNNFDADDRVVVAVSNNGGASWTPLYQFGSDTTRDDQPLTSLTNSYTTVSVPLTAYTGQTVRFAFYAGSMASGGDNYVVFDNISVQSSDCMRPIGVHVLRTDESATFSWTDLSTANDAGYELIISKINSRTDSVVTTEAIGAGDSTVTIGGLMSNTVYYYFLRSACTENPGDGSWATGSFRTACGDVDFPFEDDFENYATGNASFPECWTSIGTNNDYGDIYPRVYNYGNEHGKVIDMYGYNDYSTGTMVAATPRITAPLNSIEIAFDWYNSNGTMNVYVATNPEDTNTWHLVQTVSGSYNWQSYEEITTDSVAGLTDADTGYVLFVGTIDYTGYTSGYLDNVYIGPRSTCRRVSNLQVDADSVTSATLTWDAEEGQSEWLVYLNGELNGTATSTTYTVSGLAASSSYSVSVRALCGEGDTSRVVKVDFTTPCVAVSLPWSEDFNAVSSISDLGCWSVYNGQFDDATGTAATEDCSYCWKVVNNSSMNASPHIAVNIYGGGYYRWIVSPEIELSENADLKFDIALTEYAETTDPEVDDVDDDRFIVMVSTDGGTVWTPILQWGSQVGTRDDYSFAALTPTPDSISVVLGQFVGQTILIGFYGESTVSGGDNDLHIDNVRVIANGLPVEHDTCNVPTAVSVSVVDSTIATVSWTAGGSETRWELRLNGDDNSIVQAQSTTYVFSNLTPSTSYTVSVRAVCSDNNKSDWSTAVSFNTPAGGSGQGIESADEMGISLYPNPASSVVAVEAVEAVSLSVIDQSGRVVYRSESEATKHSVDVSQMAKGAYYVRLTGQSGTAVRKLVVK